MLDIKFIKKNSEEAKKLLGKKGVKPGDVDKVVSAYDEWTEKLQRFDTLRAKRNKIAHIGKYSEEGKKLKLDLIDFEKEVTEAQYAYKKLALQIPNLPLRDVQKGGEEDFEEIRRVGQIPKFDFEPKDHLTLGENLNLIDTKTASLVSGPRFAYLKNELVFLEYALVRHALNFLNEKGFEIVLPPVILKKEITEGLGYWHGKINEKHTANENYYLVYDPKEEQPYEDPEYYLIGTAEHAVVPMFMNKVIDDPPKKIAAFSPAFRREAGTYGKDTKGIFRVHQFEKIEMVMFTKDNESEKALTEMVTLAEELMISLGITFRTIQLAAGDISFPSAKTIDIQAWFPTQGFRETHSISTTTDFQSRRLNIKYKEKDKAKFVHILNGTAFAIGRTLIAIMENYQNKDGSITVPKVLQNYTGFNKIPK